MESLSRRMFLKRSSIAAVAAGAATSVPFLPAVLGTATAEAPAAESSLAADLPAGATMADPIVAHIRDLATGEMNLFVGTRQITYNDPQLAAKLFKAAQ